MTTNETSFCPILHHQHAVYQLGCFVLTIGLLVPPNIGPAQTLWLRVMYAICSLCFALWGGAAQCWPDALAWYLVCLAINVCHSIHLIHMMSSVKLSEDLRFIYSLIFANFNITERCFRRLVGSAAGAMVYELKASGKYALEGRTNCSKQLSLLLKGRMKVTMGGSFLHYIRKGQFIDSPEWEAVKDGNLRSFQVTIQADTDCHYLQWSRPKLEEYLKKNPVLGAVVESAIGKDITEKLYSIGEKEMEPVLYVGVEGEVEEEKPETVQLLVPDDDQLLAHRWERATSIETDIPAARPSIRSHSGTTYLTVPGAEDHGSSLSLHRRSIVDVRASMFKGSNAGSTMSSDDASHSGDYLTPPQSVRGSFTSSPATPSILVESEK